MTNPIETRASADHTEGGQSRQKSFSAMALVMAFMLISKALGFFREVALSAQFGMDEITDAYKTAFNIPCLLLSALIAAIAAVFIPVYNERRQAGEASERRFVGSLFSVGLFVSALIALGTWLMLPWLTRVMLPKATPEMVQLTIRLTGIMMPMALFVFLYRLLGAFLQARFQFTMPAVATCCSAVCVVAGILMSRGNITIVAIWTLIGMGVEFLTQLPAAFRRGFRWKPAFDLGDPGLRQIASLMLPLLIMGAFDQLYIVFDRVAASANAGDISALDYGNRITTMVSAALLVTISTVLYPSLTQTAPNKNAFAEHFSFGVNLNLLIGLPAMSALLTLRVPVTRMVFERGAFDGSHTAITAGVLACYALGMIGIGLKELCNRAFWAQKSTRTPMFVGVGGVILNIALDFPLYAWIGVSGVALASAISAASCSAVLIFLLRARVKRVGGKDILICLIKSAAATLAMTAALSLCVRLTGMTDLRGTKLIAALLGSIGIGLVSYVAFLSVLRTKELSMIFAMVKRRRSK
ncbi:MAG: murein biosynthesis integral membrane protein MurJ [Oscillospiraceae bacterium]|jgi:putative peptidoglycan lipid II flippase|nr:murein biosynthesis integral membrane protein MurJ [Oscillospiraceae bacterium]